jgi:hypothetical protein
VPTKRTRVPRAIPRRVVLVLGLGAGVNVMDTDDLRALWRKWGPAVTEHYRLRLDREPFVGRVAAQEAW